MILADAGGSVRHIAVLRSSELAGLLFPAATGKRQDPVFAIS
jgi:hypothetical protein